MPFEQESMGPKNNFDNLEKHELEEFEIKELLAEIREILADAPEIVGEMNTEMVFNNIPSYKQLEKHQDRIWESIKDLYGFDIENVDSPFRKYTVEGTPGSKGEGKIQVSLFPTNNPAIFVGRYRYPNGDEWWSLRPDVLEDEI